jgi:hypothetical protein
MLSTRSACRRRAACLCDRGHRGEAAGERHLNGRSQTGKQIRAWFGARADALAGSLQEIVAPPEVRCGQSKRCGRPNHPAGRIG